MDTNPLLCALMQLRRARVLTPQESSEASSYLGHTPPMAGHSLMVWVPHWLVAQLENDQTPRKQQFALLTGQGQHDAVFMLVVQAGSTQFRLLMHINDHRVQALLRDSRSPGCLNVLLNVEHGSELSILSTAIPDEMDSVLTRMLDAAPDLPGQIAQVLRLGAHHTSPQAVPSLLDGETVLDVVTVLVADDAELSDDEVTELTGSGPRERNSEEIATRLH
jgi:hypothetical protein